MSLSVESSRDIPSSQMIYCWVYCFCLSLSLLIESGKVIRLRRHLLWKTSSNIMSSIVGRASPFFWRHFWIIKLNCLLTVIGMGAYFSLRTLYSSSSMSEAS
jgi:hypothetical protein